jgi:hypothetical protein
MSQLTRQFTIDRNTLTQLFTLQTSLPEKLMVLLWMQHLLSAHYPHLDPQTAYLQLCQNQTQQTERIAVAATTLYLATIALGVGLLFGGKIPDKALETAGFVMGNATLFCTKQANDARDRLERAVQYKEKDAIDISPS